ENKEVNKKSSSKVYKCVHCQKKMTEDKLWKHAPRKHGHLPRQTQVHPFWPSKLLPDFLFPLSGLQDRVSVVILKASTIIYGSFLPCFYPSFAELPCLISSFRYAQFAKR